MPKLQFQLLLFGLQKQLQEAVELLDKVKNGEPLPAVTNQQLWKAQKIKQVRWFTVYNNSQLFLIITMWLTFCHKIPSKFNIFDTSIVFSLSANFDMCHLVMSLL